MAIGIRRLFPILFLLLSISSAALTGLDVSGAVGQSGDSSLGVIALFSGSEGKEAYLLLSAPADEVTVKDRSGLVLEHRIVTRGNDTLIYATVPYDYLEFSIRSDSFTAKQASLWSLDLGVGASENISSFSSTITLPTGAVLKSTNGAVEGGDGSLTLSWKTGNVGAGHLLRMKASYEIEAPEQADYPMLLAMGAIVLLAIAVAGYFMQKKQTRPPQKKQMAPQSSPMPASAAQPSLESNAVFKTLDETDKEIVRELSRQGGKATQAHLYLHTHVPKATLSRRLASLENKGLIQKSQKGNRNLVTLTEIFGG